VGGRGLGLAGAALVVERIARACASTAMVVTMHYCGTAVLEKHAGVDIRRAAAKGDHLSTLAFSEAGSRSQFWAPTSTARDDGGMVRLDARKSWVTSAHHATAYVWSSRPLAADGASTIWLVAADADGISANSRFDGLGLRGNDSAPVRGEGVRVPASAMLGPDGGGLSIMLEIVLPTFQVLSTAVALGVMDGAIDRVVEHVSATTFEHDGTALRDLPTIRAYVARMRVKTDLVRGLLVDTLAAMQSGRAETMLRVLECKAAAGETATEVLDLAMRVCGGAAFRKEVGVERMFRDARAATVMAPTTDALYEFIGRATTGLPVF
jgi:alkylation response protein AidB-like acyl-CoA dehydrogenase